VEAFHFLKIYYYRKFGIQTFVFAFPFMLIMRFLAREAYILARVFVIKTIPNSLTFSACLFIAISAVYAGCE
jgi:hypothetical protein